MYLSRSGGLPQFQPSIISVFIPLKHLRVKNTPCLLSNNRGREAGRGGQRREAGCECMCVPESACLACQSLGGLIRQDLIVFNPFNSFDAHVQHAACFLKHSAHAKVCEFRWQGDASLAHASQAPQKAKHRRGAKDSCAQGVCVCGVAPCLESAESRTLAGLMSRCTMEHRCRYATACFHLVPVVGVPCRLYKRQSCASAQV